MCDLLSGIVSKGEQSASKIMLALERQVDEAHVNLLDSKQSSFLQEPACDGSVFLTLRLPIAVFPMEQRSFINA